jgi:hypothetical protein
MLGEEPTWQRSSRYADGRVGGVDAPLESAVVCDDDSHGRTRDVSFRIVAQNNDARAADTLRDLTEFFLNGARSFELGTAFGNGLRDVRGKMITSPALPPEPTITLPPAPAAAGRVCAVLQL